MTQRERQFTSMEKMIYDQLMAHKELVPYKVIVRNDSHLHAGHEGAKSGGHFHVTVISDYFQPLNRVQRHQYIYQIFSAYLQNGIHALNLQTQTQKEYDLWLQKTNG